ncbi:TPA: hypothetical protein N3423_004524 [Klebsiella pneumoniae]|uniref:hypothetical protein n=1 Tax=Klebsiella pneumoniae TaxID=573 RepID=UPI000DA13372|nr:hypothetical protein [Klebsiella pneumoniae]HBW1565051.1 hypothetical protein [Klebsiella pneumoniae]HCB3260627.1 hypothetical protein [Klebsiella pneumoniae]HCB3315251.1 hypothetical protein [Klebsiella pneumoniae]HCM6415714.1 hypothetical protein [Klebsiella pneumoniae]HCM6420088.1 hypothetical protein [Klebsiella pneumoniae]
MTVKLGWLKYILIYIAGFLTSFSGVMDSLVKIPVSYQELKKTYIYDSAFLTGHWSNNAEYLLNSEELGLDFGQPSIVLDMQASEDGSTNGTILSEQLCDAMPLTMVISLEADAPTFRDFFLDRMFYLKQLHSGKMETLGVLKLVREDRKNGTIEFETVGDGTGALPRKIVLAKNLPEYEEDYKKISSYCEQSPMKYWKKYFEEEDKNKKTKVSD